MARKTTPTKSDPKPEPTVAPSVDDDDAPVQVEIHASRDPYRRAGLALGKQPLVIAIDDLDAAQREALEADPNVILRPVPEADDK